MQINTITITFKAMSTEDTETSIKFPAIYEEPMSDLEICEDLFRQSNTYTGELYNRIQANHFVAYGIGVRSLSMFDTVTIEDRTYKCAAFGWDRVAA